MGIARMRWSTWIPWVNTGKAAQLRPHASETRSRTPWPMPAQSILRAWPEEGDYVIDVELRLDEHDEPIVTGIAVRSAVPLEPRRDFKPQPRWPDGAEPRPIRPRDVKRLPLSEVARAAATMASATKLEPGSPEREREFEKIKRGLRPRRRGPRTDPDLKRKVLLVHDGLVLRGVSNPAKVIAEQMGEPLGTVHVWLHRARKQRAAERAAAITD